MPRVFVRAGALLASLLALAFVLAPVAPAAAAGGKSQRHIDIQMHVGAFHIDVYGNEQNGEQSATLFVARRDQFAEYIVPAEFTDSTIKAKFGTFGELDYSFAPKGSTNAECFGAGGSEAAFTGAFTFTGENNFVHIEADQATGFYGIEPEPPGCKPSRDDRAAPAARAASEQPYGGDGATLTASTLAKTTKGSRQVRALEVIGERSGNQGIFAVLAEADHGVSIVRGVEMGAPHVFEWDFKAGTATLTPPAPLTGTASLTKGTGGRTRWTGSLRMPILGEPKPVSMAGAAFNATLHHGTPPSP
jgi:hypothetical protein